MNLKNQSNHDFHLENQNIIYFANDYQTDNKTSSHQNAKILSKKNTIFYVESPGLRKIRLEKHDVNRIFSKLKVFFKGTKKINDNFFLYTLLLIPTESKVIKQISLFISVLALKYYLKKYKIKNPIIWMAVPHVEPILEKLNNIFSVYYCVDEYTELPGVDKIRITSLEKKLINSVDVVFVTSKSLQEVKQKIRKDIVYSPHFVDFTHFSKAYFDKFTIPDDIANLKNPIIGFIGLVEHWFDFRLMDYIASANKDYSFVLIGRIAVDYTPSTENIYLLGKKDYSSLPQYLQFFDACIIPFKVNDTTKYVNPIKLKEYLAAGKPIVSTYMPELTEYDDIIKIAQIDDYSDFNLKLKNILDEDNTQLTLERIEQVRDHAWENKVFFFEDVIKSYILEK